MSIFDDLTHEDYVQALKDIKQEAEAAFSSGDAMVSKWARTTGIMASLLHTFVSNTDPSTFKQPEPEKTDEGNKEDA